MDAIPMFVRDEFPNFRRLYANYTEEKLENSRLFEIDASLFKLLRLVELCFQKVSSRKYIIQREQVSRSFFFSKLTRENDTNLTHSISLEVSIHFPRNLYNFINFMKKDFTILHYDYGRIFEKNSYPREQRKFRERNVAKKGILL